MVPDLTLREEKGAPLTAKEMDTNLKRLRDHQNSLEALLGVSLNADGTIKNPLIVYGVSAAASDSYVINPNPAIAALSDLLGRLIILKADVANAGPASLNISSLGAKTIKKFGNQDLESNDIKAGQFVLLSWDGTYLQMQSQPGVVQPLNYGVDTGTANTYVVAQSGIISIPATYTAGYGVVFKAVNANTGASTLNGVALTKLNGSALVAGDILAGQVVVAIHDGTQFITASPTGTLANQLAQVGSNQSLPAAAGTITIAHGKTGVPTFPYICLVCTDAGGDAGYTQNQTVPITSFYLRIGGGTDHEYPPSVMLDSSNIKIGFSANTLSVIDPTGTLQYVTRSKWALKAYLPN